jgi:hypothetical protein
MPHVSRPSGPYAIEFVRGFRIVLVVAFHDGLQGPSVASSDALGQQAETASGPAWMSRLAFGQRAQEGGPIGPGTGTT